MTTHGLDSLLHSHQHVSWQFTVLDHNHGQVHLTGQHGGVTDSKNRRRVHQDKIETLLHILDQLGHPSGVQDPCRISWQNSGWHEVEVIDRSLQNNILEQKIRSEVIGKPHGVVDIKESVQTWTTEVGIDHQRRVSSLRADVGEVDHRSRLTFTSTTGNHGD